MTHFVRTIRTWITTSLGNKIQIGLIGLYFHKHGKALFVETLLVGLFSLVCSEFLLNAASRAARLFQLHMTAYMIVEPFKFSTTQKVNCI